MAFGVVRVFLKARCQEGDSPTEIFGMGVFGFVIFDVGNAESEIGGRVCFREKAFQDDGGIGTVLLERIYDALGAFRNFFRIQWSVKLTCKMSAVAPWRIWQATQSAPGR